MDATTTNLIDRHTPLDVRDQFARLIADAPVSPFDLKPLCPTCSRPNRLAIDDTGTWLIAEHTCPIDPSYNCAGSNDPVSYASYEDAIAVSASSSVHAGESTYSRNQSFKSAGLDKTYSDDERDFRHSGWSTIRTRVRTALDKASVPERRRVAFAYCGSNAWVMKSTTEKDKYRVASSHCHDRFCTPCALDRSHVIRCNLRRILQDRRKHLAGTQEYTHRFLTLTVKTRPGEPLRNTLDDLAGWFKTLRGTPLWKSCVSGGVAMLELKWMPVPGRWHPHLHVIIEGDRLDWYTLKRLWHDITLKSYICHIRKIDDDEHAVWYVTKYASKALDGSYAHDHDRLVEAIEALSGRKLLATFGTWYRYALLRREAVHGWSLAMTYNTLILRARSGDRESQRILAMLTRAKPNLEADPDPQRPKEPP